MPLSNAAVKAAKALQKPYKLADAQGLYLHVMPTGARYWRVKYRFAGKEKLLALGVYPEVTLADARGLRDAARAQLRAGVDPAGQRKADRRATRERHGNSFQAVAREWVEQRAGLWKASHSARVLGSLEANIFPDLGDRPVSEITARELLQSLRSIEKRDALDVASRVAQRCSSVFRYAIQTDRALSNPAAELRGALKTRKVTHRAALARSELPGFFAKLKAYDGRPETRIAVRLLMLTFVRPGELRGAEWTEFDLDAAEWRIPASRMKMGEEHVVPLSTHAVEQLRELRTITGWGPLCLPGISDPRKPISANTVLFALYRMGYHKRATGHGFRALASTCLNEMGWRPDVIERQLAHAERNKVRAAYNRATFMAERREMMQGWGDFLHAQEHGASVLPIRKRNSSRSRPG